MADGFSLNASALLSAVSNMDNRFEQQVLARLNTSAAMLENYAKQNRPWTDRTGQARQRLNCRASKSGATRYRLTLAHGVSYGAELEYGHEERYAIIMPTLEAKGGDVMTQFNRLIESM